ncbi:hypothetical protein NUU61_009294 [Penicillium alfredii]|uniref:Exocyst complex component Sec3 PIP2-binding N-terminal domain-containing protein n=1 Tax=Penicillium alfredii TaxID=1506179 RepID=A0A9W9EN01_9EURO|nr:uncharacterized protein NUU61_009294 [Penicillium alfredii]KAJ5084715.1 hypothetical protein NUU61_009294 [Penicillium alfredii]
MNGRDRPRGGDTRHGAGDGSMSRAEKFEDEKKRIVQSCYSKKDNDGTLVESYITHVRITEDAAHPSAPGPPNASSETKKARVIIVSVRRSGRVRMHKARENNDGTFSIGKTWMLDDLSAIQSYNAFVPRTPAEQQQKEWASNLGFVVTVGKPYYWHARSAKEKEFFIGSLVKIYKKYTGGKVPNLVGFDERERQLLAGSSGASSSPAPPPSRGAGLAPPSEGPSPQPQSSYSSRDPSRDAPRDVRRKPSEDPVPVLRPQRSREQLPRPSTGQSKPAPSPFGPPQIPSSTISSGPSMIAPGQREQTPPRVNERPAAETKPQVAAALTAEPRNKEPEPSSHIKIPEAIRPSSSRVEERIPKAQPPPLVTKHVEARAPEPKPSTDGLRPSRFGASEDSRPSSSREEERLPRPQRPALAPPALEPMAPESKRSADGLRPARIDVYDYSRPSSSRDEDRLLKTQPPPLSVKPSETKLPEFKPSIDSLRPTTPGSSAGENRSAAPSPAPSPGQKSLHHGGVDKPSPANQLPPPQDQAASKLPPAPAASARPEPIAPFMADEQTPPPMLDPAVAAAVTAATVASEESNKSPDEVKPLPAIEPPRDVEPAQDIQPARDVKPVQDVNAVHDTEPAREVKQVHDVKPLPDIEPVHDAKPVHYIPPVREVKPDQDVKPDPEIQQAREVKPAQDVQPVPEIQQAQEVKPAQDVKPDPDIQEAREVKPVQDVKPVPGIQPTLDVKTVQDVELMGEITTDSPPVVPPTPVDDDEVESEGHRPGLGPMVKPKSSKDVAGAFRKAANAYGAFKPRRGGAGERLLAAAKKQKAEETDADGITGVFPAPSISRPGNEPPKSPVTETVEKELPAPAPSTPPEAPTVEITHPAIEEPVVAPEAAEEVNDSLTDGANGAARSRTPSPAGQGRRRRRREDNTIKYCQALGIDPGVLDGRGIDFDDILTDLGWSGRLSDDKKIEDLEADIRREIGRVEATSWLGNLEQQEGKVEQLAGLIDKTIEECEELDGLLTLYSHELNTLNEDVAYIEAQSQGLQVQTANQKLLQNELQNLLKTLSISSFEMRPLKEASLSNTAALQGTESALSTLYKAMLMIDSDLGQNKKRLVDSSVGVYADTEIGQMRAIKQKKEEYRSAAMMFLHRLKQFMGLAFKMAEQKRAEATIRSSKDPMKLDSSARQHFRREIWMYNPLMLFAREVSMAEWHGLVGLYEQQSKPSYQNEFRDNNLAWKQTARKPTGEEQELLFTHQEKEKEAEGITMAARKLTVRRGKTVRAAAGARLAPGEKKKGKVEPCEAFAGTLRESLNMMAEEQNFVIRFFHLDSLATTDFSDLVASAHPEARKCPEFSTKQSHDPDRVMAKRVEQIMDEVYSFWPNDMQGIVDWAIKADPLQGIGMLFALETAMADFDDTNQEFILHSLQKLHSRLMGLFNRFVEEQIRGIEDTKVKVNKRKGVISFMRIFPHFSTVIENMLTGPSGEFCDMRVSVNDAYERINRAMWESLKFIAKEAPGQPAGVAANATAGDPEDKEVLNYHILLIENMNHYMEEVDAHNTPVLQRWSDRARQDFQEHMRLYLDAVIRRPLGKLLDFIQSVENLQTANSNPTDIATRSSHSRMVAKKVLSSYDNKEIRRGIEMLKKRVEKHFGDADDPGLSRSLVLKVLRECEGRYEEVYNRTRRIVDTVYEGQLDLEWRKEDTLSMFRK